MINNVNKYPISTLFEVESNQIYQIPKYQREYTWTASNWENLFDDLMDNDLGYFLGSIICINITSNTLSSPMLEVVDGQQRLTTLSLLLAALYAQLDHLNESLNEDQRSDLRQLKLKLILKRSPMLTRIVPQTQNSNLSDYLALLSETKVLDKRIIPKNARNRRIFKAHKYFMKRIENQIGNQEDKIKALFDIADKINSAIIVMIEVSNHSDAYMLFESLNNRGTPLTAVDLIKNLLLARLDRKGDGKIDEYFIKWTQILNNIGEEYQVQERFFRHNYNAFRREINEPFKKSGMTDRQYPLGTMATRKTMLSIYEQVITQDPDGIIDDLLDHSYLYSTLLQNLENVSTPLRDAYTDLERIQGTPSYLLLLFILKNRDKLKVDDVIMSKTSNLLANFFVRRNLTNFPATGDLTRLFMGLVERIENEGQTGDAIFDLLHSQLKNQSSTDLVFEQWLRGPIYDENIGATRFILCALAKKGMTKESYLDLWKLNNPWQYVWTIEHIFPQGENIPDGWVQMIADGDRSLAKQYQDKYVHTFGNLTISGYNSTLGNRTFEEKKERKDSNGNYIGYRNGINLNADVFIEERWTVEAIKKRTDRMVREIMELFKL